MMTNVMQFDKEEYESLVKQYNQAVNDKKEEFLFNGEYLLVTEYAKYLIEYLSSRFGKVKTTSHE